MRNLSKPPCRQAKVAFQSLAILLSACLGAIVLPAQQPDSASVIRGIDAAVHARVDAIEGYTDTEHYAVYRSNDENHPVAEMTVKTTYNHDTGKSYEVLAESGPAVLQKFVLNSILENEKHINEPAVREGSWLTSANYDMKLRPGGAQQLDGRNCFIVDITPKRKAPYLVEGTIWVDATDETLVQLQGTSSKSPSMFTGPTQMMRQYINLNGFAEATHARAVSDSHLFGETIVKIDYSGYQIQLRSGR